MPAGLGFDRVVRALKGRRNARRLWGAAGSGFLVPPLRSFGAFGERTLLIPPTRVQSPEDIYLGSNIEIQEHAWLCVVPRPDLPRPKLIVGDRVFAARFVKVVCTAEVSIGDDTMIGDHAFITDTQYAHDDPGMTIAKQGLGTARPVRIGHRAHIGHRAIIGPGVTIGDNAYIGAGAVVLDDVPARAIVVGHPARVLRILDEVAGDQEPVHRDA
jgi:acetyltransferase-like isoleucine patch superfamily enzyme